jgi:hypothetical protein
VAIFSLDMTGKLVAAGVVAKTLAVTGATAGTPLVLTSTAHGVLPARPVHAVVSNVGGIAVPGTDGSRWICELAATDADHLGVYSYTPQGVRFQVTATGTYTSGGTIQVAFPDGRVLLGRRNVDRYSAPPRVVFVPYGIEQFDFQSYGGNIPTAIPPVTLGDITLEQQSMMLRRQVGTERQRFEVHSWGAAVPPDPEAGDFDVCQALYHQVIETVFSLCPDMRVVSGVWKSQMPASPNGPGQWGKRGEEHVMVLEVAQPVLDSSLAFVPASTDGTITVALSGGSTSDDLIIEVP